MLCDHLQAIDKRKILGYIYLMRKKELQLDMFTNVNIILPSLQLFETEFSDFRRKICSSYNLARNKTEFIDMALTNLQVASWAAVY